MRRRRILLLLICISSLLRLDDCRKHSKSQFRIIGGQRSSSAKYPFLAAFFFLSDSRMCSAVVVTSRVALTAAHCLPPKILRLESCREFSSRIADPRLKGCKRLREGDLRLRMSERRNGSWLIVNKDNLGLTGARDTDKKHYIKYIYKHGKTYYGGGYGSRGGFDIVLLKVFSHTSLTGFKRLRLPSAGYNDVSGKAVIAGYGNSRRIPCEVDKYGPEKFAFCGMKPDCNEYDEFCPVQFNTTAGETHYGCSLKMTPSYENAECRAFSERFNVSFDQTEAALVKNGKRLSTVCYPVNPGQFGWCGTVQNILKTGKNDQKVEISYEKGWGFCDKLCDEEYKKREIERKSSLFLGVGVIREKIVDVLDQNYCYKDINETTFEIRPEILCAGINRTFNTKFFDSDSGERLTLTLSEELSLMNRTSEWYVSAPGDCMGDSGGPLLRKEPGGGLVLLGIVSKGTRATHCGGRETVTNYLRIKSFVNWIKKYAKDVKTIRGNHNEYIIFK